MYDMQDRVVVLKELNTFSFPREEDTFLEELNSFCSRRYESLGPSFERLMLAFFPDNIECLSLWLPYTYLAK